MEVNFTPETEAKVARAAAVSKSSTAEYVQQLVEHYVDHDVWFRQQVKEGLDQLDYGESLTHDDVKARIQKMFPS